MQGHSGVRCVFQTFPPCGACAPKEHLRRVLTKEFGISQLPTARARQRWKQMEADPIPGTSSYGVVMSEFPDGNCMPNPGPKVVATLSVGSPLTLPVADSWLLAAWLTVFKFTLVYSPDCCLIGMVCQSRGTRTGCAKWKLREFPHLTITSNFFCLMDTILPGSLLRWDH